MFGIVEGRRLHRPLTDHAAPRGDRARTRGTQPPWVAGRFFSAETKYLTGADRPPSPTGLTVRDVARRYRVGEDKVRSWIARGELAAVNTSATLCGRPRFVVLPEHLAAFERRRAATPPPRPPRRKRTARVDFYPD
jgi:hypothetical protein